MEGGRKGLAWEGGGAKTQILSSLCVCMCVCVFRLFIVGLL